MDGYGWVCVWCVWMDGFLGSWRDGGRGWTYGRSQTIARHLSRWGLFDVYMYASLHYVTIASGNGYRLFVVKLFPEIRLAYWRFHNYEQSNIFLEKKCDYAVCKIGAFLFRPQYVNSPWPSDAFMRQWIKSSLFQVIVCRLFSTSATISTNVTTLLIGTYVINFL